MNYKNNLHKELVELKKILDDQTQEKYKRINPFSENLIDWKDKAKQWFGEDKNITIYDSTTLVGDIKIGENTWIGPFCSLDGSGGLKIGKNCSISAGTHIQTHDAAKWSLSGAKSDYEYKPVKIGNNCFIGVNCVIVAGVSIGTRCLVAAGSVVTKNFDKSTIVAGVPAKEIGKVLLIEGSIKFEYFK
jgi:acetyltransferase-like isoleucine patch superfamily enzyme